MQGANNQAFLILLTFIIVATIQITQANAGKSINATIIETCNQTTKRNFCSSILKLDPRTPNAQSVADMCTILVFHVDDSVSKAWNHVLGLIRRRDIEGPLRDHLLKCMELYEGPVKSKYIETLASVNLKNYSDAQRLMNELQVMALQCPGSFAPPIKSPILDDTKEIDDACKVSFDVLRYLNSHAA